MEPKAREICSAKGYKYQGYPSIEKNSEIPLSYIPIIGEITN
jgi:hypothetical protein